jgi:hypothetical protein
MQLGWFVDSEPREQRPRAHENDTCVGHLLCAIELALMQRMRTDPHIVQYQGLLH